MTSDARKALPALLAPLLLACGSGPLAPAHELERNLALWRAQAIDSYTYDYQLHCFCGGPAIQPVTIEVREGEVVRVTSRDTGEPLDPEHLEDFPTVEELFETIRDALERDPFRFEAIYDPELGHPREVFVDFEEQVNDEERGFTAANLEAAPAP